MTATIRVFLVRPRKGMNPTCSAPCELCERYGKLRWKFSVLPIGSMGQVHTTYIYHTFTIKSPHSLFGKKVGQPGDNYYCNQDDPLDLW